MNEDDKIELIKLEASDELARCYIVSMLCEAYGYGDPRHLSDETFLSLAREADD
jgi:hypothetical protein